MYNPTKLYSRYELYACMDGIPPLSRSFEEIYPSRDG